MSIYQILSDTEISTLHIKEENPLEEIYLNDKSEFSHLLTYDYNKKYKLVVDTFNNSLDLIDRKILFDLFNKGKINSSIYKYLLHRFTPPNSGEGKIKLKNIYNNFLEERRSYSVNVYGICPTYSCNMGCDYCYQKNRRSSNKLISEKELENIFHFITQKNPTTIELFGGEPLQKKNRKIISKIFSFCKRYEYPLTITTNGLDLYDYLDLLVIYHRYILRVTTTLDGVERVHNLRRCVKNGLKNGFSIISNGIDFLLNLGIDTDLYINLDYKNLDQLLPILEYCETKSWLNNDNFKIRIGRVDDRCFENVSSNIMSESDLLYQITLLFENNHKAPNNFQLAFLKTILPLAQLFNIDFGQNELTAKYHYCSSTSPFIKGFYIDSELDVYRCPYTVGNKHFLIGNIRKEIDVGPWEKHLLFFLPECLSCPLGGYCSGGCYVSKLINQKKSCLYEKENFDNFIKTLIIPRIKAMFKDVE